MIINRGIATLITKRFMFLPIIEKVIKINFQGLYLSQGDIMNTKVEKTRRSIMHVPALLKWFFKNEILKTFCLSETSKGKEAYL